jgi:hypothetical protein
MRKTDYATLARVINEQLRACLTLSDSHAQSIAISKLRIVAMSFALNASVDSGAFLKACGID